MREYDLVRQALMEESSVLPDHVAAQGPGPQGSVQSDAQGEAAPGSLALSLDSIEFGIELNPAYALTESHLDPSWLSMR